MVPLHHPSIKGRTLLAERQNTRMTTGKSVLGCHGSLWSKGPKLAGSDVNKIDRRVVTSRWQDIWALNVWKCECGSMCLYVHECMHVCMHVCIVCACVWVCVHIYVHLCMHCVHVCVCMRVYTRVHTCVCCTCVHACVCVHACICPGFLLAAWH